MWLCSCAVMKIHPAPLLGGRALKNSPVGYFSEGARLQGRFVVEGLGVGLMLWSYEAAMFCLNRKTAPTLRSGSTLRFDKTAKLFFSSYLRFGLSILDPEVVPDSPLLDSAALLSDSLTSLALDSASLL